MNKEVLLNRRQREIFAFIKESLLKNGYPPSVREIGRAVGLKSSSTVHSHLAKIEELGLIKRDPTKPRAIDLLDEKPWMQKSMLSVPLVGRITAGQPILATENIEEIYPFPEELLGTRDTVFMLEVQGASMIGAGIFDGDYILVREQNTAHNGDIVVALLEHESATVKRFFKEADMVRLQPENDAMEPIYAREVCILGKVIGIFRKI